MKEIEQVGRRRPQPLDLERVYAADVADDLLGGIAARAIVEQATERPLIVRAFVNVGNAQLGLPQPGMVGALEDLPLFGDRVDNRFQ